MANSASPRAARTPVEVSAQTAFETWTAIRGTGTPVARGTPRGTFEKASMPAGSPMAGIASSRRWHLYAHGGPTNGRSSGCMTSGYGSRVSKSWRGDATLPPIDFPGTRWRRFIDWSAAPIRATSKQRLVVSQGRAFWIGPNAGSSSLLSCGASMPAGILRSIGWSNSSSTIDEGFQFRVEPCDSWRACRARSPLRPSWVTFSGASITEMASAYLTGDVRPLGWPRRLT